MFEPEVVPYVLLKVSEPAPPVIIELLVAAPVTVIFSALQVIVPLFTRVFAIVVVADAEFPTTELPVVFVQLPETVTVPAPSLIVVELDRSPPTVTIGSCVFQSSDPPLAVKL